MQPLGKALPFTNVIDVALYFNDKQTCLEYLTRLRWPKHTTCVFCNHEKVYELKGELKKYKCAKCRKHFSVNYGICCKYLIYAILIVYYSIIYSIDGTGNFSHART